jgi:hypothetical protein
MSIKLFATAKLFASCSEYMTLNASTIKRLQRLPQVSSVWEGSKLELPGKLGLASDDESDERQMIIWMDGTEGTVRSLESVGSDMGHEALVRSLLRAIEHPQGPYPPVRPQKILVSDREEQFYLRGVLRALDIDVEYSSHLPLVAQLLERFDEMSSLQSEQLPPAHTEILQAVARDIWQATPWQLLPDHQILQISIQRWDIDQLYACVMGMMGMEYGILLYRSIESVQQFRRAALQNDGFQDMEAVFLAQDCIFLTFDSDLETRRSPRRQPENFESHYGVIHPLEGLRTVLGQDEALATYAALSAMQRFITNHSAQLGREELPEISQKVRISLPANIPNLPKSINVAVATMPQASQELWEMQNDEEFDDDAILEDLVPDKAAVSLGVIPWDNLRLMQPDAAVLRGKPNGDGLPVIMIQTTRAKAQVMINKIEAAGGLQGIIFNLGEGLLEDTYELGLLQLADGQMQLFGEFGLDDSTHIAARGKWLQRCQKTKGRCGLIIAQGLTGKARGNPQPKDVLAVIETMSLEPAELGLGVLKLVTD